MLKVQRKLYLCTLKLQKAASTNPLKTKKQIKNEAKISNTGEPVEGDGQKNMSAAELGRRVGCSRQAIRKILNGETDPSISRVIAIAKALEISILDLYPE